MHTGNLIRQIRKSLGMTQMELAEKIGVSYQQVQKYEKGVSELTLKRLRQVASALDVPMSTFIGEGGECPPIANLPADDDESTALMLLRRLKDKKLALKVLKAMTEP